MILNSYVKWQNIKQRGQIQCVQLTGTLKSISDKFKTLKTVYCKSKAYRRVWIEKKKCYFWFAHPSAASEKAITVQLQKWWLLWIKQTLNIQEELLLLAATLYNFQGMLWSMIAINTLPIFKSSMKEQPTIFLNQQNFNPTRVKKTYSTHSLSHTLEQQMWR